MSNDKTTLVATTQDVFLSEKENELIGRLHSINISELLHEKSEPKQTLSCLNAINAFNSAFTNTITI
ncbi:hypothetical protein HQQ94_14825 [Shewanella sp. VB17]|uniref:hypothetical protein n=1 Tax=Shewanella sp. VB17 TaxID=2739432 RepID=UPI0015658155|nr:hypothetical protein [Shewanella sp. VB17]NRD74486.1 hypothetical protein [Shewanella sp. VB17]